MLTDDILETYLDADSYLVRGRAFWRLGRYDLMNLAADRALEIQPENAAALNLKGKYFEELQKYDKSFEYYDRALKLEHAGRPLIPLKEVIENAHRLNNEGKYNEVVSFLTDDVLKTYHHANLYAELALAYWKLGQYGRVTEAADKALEIQPNHAFALNLKGRYFEAVKNFEQSIEYYDRSIKLEHLGEDLPALKDVIDKVTKLNAEKKFNEVVSELTEEVLKTYHHADLYAELGFAHWKLEQYELMNADADKALEIQPYQIKALNLKGKYYEALYTHDKSFENYDKSLEYFDRSLKLEYAGKTLMPLKEAIEKARDLNDHGKNSEVISFLTPEFLKTYSNADLYSELALAYWRLSNYDPVEKAADDALALNPRHVDALNLKGNFFLTKKQRDKAREAYYDALKIDPGYYILYYNLGIVYAEEKNTDAAIKNYKQAIALKPEHADSHYNLGLVYEGLENFPEALEAYKKAAEFAPTFAFAYYGLGLAHTALQKNEDAIAAFTEFLKLKENDHDTNNLYYSFAKSEIERLNKLLDSPDYESIGSLVNKIKNLLEFEEPEVTHYTSLSTAKALILNGSKLRLSEGTFLNDTSEGRELARFLDISKPQAAPEQSKAKGKEEDIFSTRFVKKPFIGSFVAASRQNNLTLWRMYGKEEKDEAKGCAITIGAIQMLADLKKELLSRAANTSRVIRSSETEGSRGGATLNVEQSSRAKVESKDFKFYRVAYLKEEDKRFIVPGFEKEKEDTLNDYMDDLKRAAVNVNSKDEKQTHDLIELLNEIAYLFKSAEYLYEHEVRLIIKDMEIFEKMSEKPPRVYIELVTIKPLIRTITLGPKVERADEWASSFYYSFYKEVKLPEIRISHLPFK